MNKKHMLTRIFIFNMLSILLFVIFVLPTCAESNNIMPEETVLCDVSDQHKMIDQIETLQSNIAKNNLEIVTSSNSIKSETEENYNAENNYGPVYDENLQRTKDLDYIKSYYGPAYDIIKKEKMLYEEVENYDMYVNAVSGLKVRSTPDTIDDTNVIKILPIATKLTIVGKTESNWVAVKIDDEIGFVCSDYIQDTVPDTEEITYNHNWSGPVLNKRAGVVYGPNGKETYYNLPMNGVIKYMRKMGLNGRVWTRSDGAKMYEKYVMIAADLSKYPKGSLVEISLGTGIVVDTGAFVHNGSGVAFDVATAW